MTKENFRNAGKSRDEKIQNYFTACLRTALRRERARDLFQRDRERKNPQDQPGEEWLAENGGGLHFLGTQGTTQKLPPSWGAVF